MIMMCVSSSRKRATCPLGTFLLLLLCLGSDLAYLKPTRPARLGAIPQAPPMRIATLLVHERFTFPHLHHLTTRRYFRPSRSLPRREEVVLDVFDPG